MSEEHELKPWVYKMNGIGLKERINDKIRQTKTVHGQSYYEKCFLVMSSDAYNCLHDYLESRSTQCGDRPIYSDTHPRMYRGMKIKEDPTLKEDFEIVPEWILLERIHADATGSWDFSSTDDEIGSLQMNLKVSVKERRKRERLIRNILDKAILWRDYFPHFYSITEKNLRDAVDDLRKHRQLYGLSEIEEKKK